MKCYLRNDMKYIPIHKCIQEQNVNLIGIKAQEG